MVVVIAHDDCSLLVYTSFSMCCAKAATERKLNAKSLVEAVPASTVSYKQQEIKMRTLVKLATYAAIATVLYGVVHFRSLAFVK